MAGKPEIVQPQRILLVTGMLGAGKTTVLRELEDLGWEALDNFPVRFLRRLIGREGDRESDSPPLAIGFDCRTRGFQPDVADLELARGDRWGRCPDAAFAPLE